MKRRLSIGMGIVADCRILILDEPTTGLDPLIRDQIWQLIKTLKKDRCILMTTQHLEEAEELADHLALLETGKLVSSGTVDEIKKRYGVGYNLRINGTSKIHLKQVSDIICTMIPESYVSSTKQWD